MLDPKYVPYLAKKSAKAEHGYDYIVLMKDVPKYLFNEYMKIVKEQDERIAQGKRIIIF